jgi:hypothetical protein
MGKRSAVVELFLGNMGSIQRELRPSTQREDQLTMETKLEQLAVKAVNQLPKSVVRKSARHVLWEPGAGDRLRRPGGRGEILVPTATIGHAADRPNSNAAPVAIMRAEKAEICCPIAQ